MTTKFVRQATGDTRKTKSYMSPLWRSSFCIGMQILQCGMSSPQKDWTYCQSLQSKSVSSGPKSTHSLKDSEISMTDDTSYKLFMM